MTMSTTEMPPIAAVQAPLPAGEARAAAVDVRNLDFFYGKTRALNGINLAFPSRTVTALIGPSGCGKSTLLRCINRIYSLYPGQRATGEIRFNGINVLDDKTDVEALRSRIGMVFQKPTPFPMSIYENVAYGAKLMGGLSRAEVNDVVERALRRAALWDEVKDKLKTSGLGLSGGQQQRLCVARTIAANPEVILLDEPASALDPISTAKIEQLIAELVRDYTIVIVTHNMQQAARVSSYTALMHLGDLVEHGNTSQIFTRPQEKRTQDYIEGRYG